MASGTNTAAFQVGGALGTAIVSSVVASRAGGAARSPALRYRSGLVTVVVVCVALVLLRPSGHGASGGSRRAARASR